MRPGTLARASELPSNYDIQMVRGLVGMSQESFARALGISVHTLRNWEQGRRSPRGPALALLRIASRHPAVFLDALTPQGPL